MKQRLFTAMIIIGLLLVAAGTLMPLFAGIQNPTFKYIYAAGALLAFAGRICTPYEGDNLRLKRLHRLESWSALVFCVGAFFLFYPAGNNFRDVLAFTLAGAAIQIYASIMLSLKRE